ncbi:HD domain-containing phosphohydrolase [Pseudomonas sp. N040]|uniref:HD domain-containing phosphohydrolase n=1 Tax=Pseudomonas sp. N040 TaxID=2785325 RepID=UPI0018A33035|nr:HD domain-containing phosphohydrolase [Pseudomonas sp. N040]MBF7728930.1 GAF domain-containing protein [Pseudomonas sp. N040]MBW7012570.1 GAF domain-containing protein [Pseudomonas sp. N040]
MPSRRIPFAVHISYLFIGLLLAYAAITGSFQYIETRRLITTEVGQRYALIGQQAIGELQNLYRPAAMSTALLARQPLAQATSLEQRLDSLAWLATALDAQPNANSMYFGYASGDFFMLRRWRDNPQLQTLFQPPADTAWIVQSIQRKDGGMLGEHLFFRADLSLIERRGKPDYQFDPRQRDWYMQARNSSSLQVTRPYLFASTREAGLTFAKAASTGAGVAGLDITLRSLNQVLMASKVTPGTRIVLLNEEGQVLSSHLGPATMLATADGQGRLPQIGDFDLPMLETLMRETPASGGTFNSFEDPQGNAWEGGPISLPEFGGSRLTLWIASPHAELLAGVLASLQRGLYIVSGLLLLGILAAVGLSRLASRPLAGLTREAGKIQRFDFEEALEVESQIAEVVDLAEAMGNMKGTIKRFLQLSTALASETNFNSLLARLLREMQAVTGADASLIYLADADASHLELARVRQRGSLLDGHGLQVLVTGEDLGHPLLQGLDEQLPPRPLSVEELQTFFPALREIAHSLTLWVLPLRNRDGILLGALALLVDEQRHSLSKELMAFVRALSTTAAIALNTQRLIEEQKVLLESFIELIAGAIDSKSPYTGGHCQRVPELTKMLARAACAERQGPFAEFELTDDQWEELHIAAWLHDCGKVTTPEYVVDKATKLETLYDRIHEVRMRFEVLKRDAEIACLKALAAGGDAAALQAGLAAQLRQLDDDFAFVAQCNEGGESMTTEQLERLQALARRSWTRTLSDRLGISYEERQRKQRNPEPALPVSEALLADKPEHLFLRRERERLAADNPWGFKVSVPEYLYNRGELYNLCVRRGTLSEEERFKINEHIIQTIIMLEKLPFPRHLQHVPEIAGGHHEKMDGSGYPKRLTRAQMSVPARMMAIADIFEALTAIDRPYKQGKLLSEAIRIMGAMKQDQHIDPELFELFLRSGVYREYAERYLQPEQIDAVDIQVYLG